MTTKPAGLGIIHKILMLFDAINIIGDVGNPHFGGQTLRRVQYN